eukprot:SAG31_NODE_7835_length_1586_cov_1.302623_2_plen_168_part_00
MYRTVVATRGSGEVCFGPACHSLESKMNADPALPKACLSSRGGSRESVGLWVDIKLYPSKCERGTKRVAFSGVKSLSMKMTETCMGAPVVYGSGTKAAWLWVLNGQSLWNPRESRGSGVPSDFGNRVRSPLLVIFIVLVALDAVQAVQRSQYTRNHEVRIRPYAVRC